MSGPGASEVYVSARRALLDALEALVDHLDALVLVGAQAIYVHTGEADVAIATHTKDGDLMLNPAALRANPLIEEAMKAAKFTLNLKRRQPGEWLSPDGVPVDLLVPEALGGSGRNRRGARIPPHSKAATRKVTGLEPAVLDNEPKAITALEASDARQFELRVAGPSALLIAKLHKLGDRQMNGKRLEDKDAHDVYRLMRAVPTTTFAGTITALRDHQLTGEVTAAAVALLEHLFSLPTSLGSEMAGRAETLVGDPAVTSAAVSSLALDLLDALNSGRRN